MREADDIGMQAGDRQRDPDMVGMLEHASFIQL
jgi:hypothetical protein